MIHLGYSITCKCGHSFLWPNQDLTKVKCPKCKKFLNKNYKLRGKRGKKV